MDISFKGFKNAGVQSLKFFDYTGERARMNLLNCELTNDITGNDLEIFERVLKKFPNDLNHNFLNIQLWEYKKGSDNAYQSSKLFINNKECPVNNKNLSGLERIANLLKRIIKTNNENFVVNNDYIDNDAKDSFVHIHDEYSRELLNTMHEPKGVKTVAKRIIKELTNMVDVFLS